MPRVVILGGGIIGLSTAYYLSTLPSSNGSSRTTSDGSEEERLEIHIVEASPTLFASASGYAAGFLAKDWFSPVVNPLGELSFDLHKQLADQWGGREKWGWTESVGWSLDRPSDESSMTSESEADSSQSGEGQGTPGTSGSSGSDTRRGSDEENNVPKPPSSDPKSDLDWLLAGSSRTAILSGSGTLVSSETEDPDAEYPSWLRANLSALQPISERTTTGQVDPLRLCRFLLDQCVANGVILHHPARATEVIKTNPSDPHSSTSVRLEVVEVSESDTERNKGNHESTSSSPVELASPSAEPMSIISSPQPVGRSGSGSVGGSSGAWSTGPGTSFSSGPRSYGASSSLANGGSEFGSVLGPYSPVSSFARDSSPGSDDHGSTSPSSKEHNLWGTRRTKTIDIVCDSLVITAGCWTPRVYRTLFPHARRVPKVTSLAGHSLVLKSRRWSDPAEGDGGVDSSIPANAPRLCHAIFTSDPAGFSPEIFSRAGGDIWIGGLNSSTLPLPTLASDAHGMMSRSSLRTLTEVARKLCGSDIEVIREGLCFRPVTPAGKPIIARIGDRDLGEGVKPKGGVFVSAGHGPWGISLSLGTGHVLGEMVMGKEPSVNISGMSRWDAQGD